MSGMILTNNFWGCVTDEWKGVRGSPVWAMSTGIVIQPAWMALLGQI